MNTFKEQLIEEAKKEPRVEMRMNRLREALHHLLLQEADRKGAFAQISFVGGTALRIIYGLNRFSEDLDFSLSYQWKRPFELSPLTKALRRSLEVFGFDCQIEGMKTENNVQKCFFSFPGLLHQIAPSIDPRKKLAIKFDIDCRSPEGGIEVVTPITAKRIYKVRHYDLPSLFAGKLHAILYRGYTKGRDLYDFLWYIGRNVTANQPLLQNAIEQTQNIRLELTEGDLKGLLKDKIEKLDFKKAKEDVVSFLEDPESVELFNKELFLGAVEKIHLL